MREYQKIRQYIVEKYLIDINDRCRALPRAYLKAIASNVLYKMYDYDHAQISAWLGIHRTTIYHYLEHHEGKYRFHPGYGEMFDDVWGYMMGQPDIVVNLNEIKQILCDTFGTTE
jgi:hypothetical protein